MITKFIKKSMLNIAGKLYSNCQKCYYAPTFHTVNFFVLKREVNAGNLQTANWLKNEEIHYRVEFN